MEESSIVKLPPNIKSTISGKWRTVFDGLAFDDAVQFRCNDRQDASKQGAMLQNYVRKHAFNKGYKVHSFTKEMENTCWLYLYKEQITKA